MLAHVNSRLVKFINALPRCTQPLIGMEHVRVGLVISPTLVRVKFTPGYAFRRLWRWLNEPALTIRIRNINDRME